MGRAGDLLATALMAAVVWPCGCAGNKSAASKPAQPSAAPQPAAREASWLRVTPHNPEVGLGEKVNFSLRGFDNQDMEVKVSPRWSATRGSIDGSGRLVAPARKGISVVTAEDTISGLKAFTVVYVGQEPLPATEKPKAQPRPGPRPEPETATEVARGPGTKTPGAVAQPPVAERKMVILAWKVGGKGFRRHAVCSAACYAPESRWVKLYAVSPAGKLSLLQSRFAKAGTTSNFSVDFARSEAKWLELRLYDRNNRLVASERREAR